MSWHQVALVQEAAGWRVEDLSGHGTRVSGRLTDRGELEDGAQLQLGLWSAVFRLSGSASPEGPTRRGTGTDVKPIEAMEEKPRPAQLRVTWGSTERIYPLGDIPLTVGKDPGNAVVIEDRFISGQHVELTRRGAALHVRDLNSTNGTFVGGVRLPEDRRERSVLR